MCILTNYSSYLCAVDSSAVLIGMWVPNDEASRGLSVHFVSSVAFPGPPLAARRGSSTTDESLSEGTFLNRAEREGGSQHRGGKVTS